MAQEITFILKARNDAAKATKELKRDLDAVGISVDEVAQNSQQAANATKELGGSASKAARGFALLSAAVLKVGGAITAAFAPLISGALGTALAGIASTTLIGRISLLTAGFVALGSALAGLIVFGAAAKAAASFNAAVAETATLVGNSPDQIAQLEAAVTGLVGAYGGNAVDQTQAFYQAISAGANDVREAAVLVEQANQLAIGGITSVSTGVDILSTVVNSYGSETITAQEASDALFVAMQNGKTTVDELAGSLSNVVPIANAAGVNFDEVSAAVSALTTQGIQTNVATTQLRAILQSVIRPTAQAAEAAAKLGIEFNLSALQAQGLEGFLLNVRDAADGDVSTISRLFESVEALGGVLALTGGGAQAFSDTLEDLENKAGATQEAFDTVSAALSSRLSRSLAQISDVFRRFGTIVLAIVVPPLELFAATLTLVANNIDVVIVALTLLSVKAFPALIKVIGTAVGAFKGFIATGLTFTAVATGQAGAVNLLSAALGGRLLTSLRGVLGSLPLVGGALSRLTGSAAGAAGGLRGLSAGAGIVATIFKTLGVAFKLLPFGAVIAGVTGLIRVVRSSKKEVEALTKSTEAAATAQENFAEALGKVDEARTDETLAAARRASDQLVAALRNGLKVAQEELEKAEFRTNFFGVTAFETTRLREARERVQELQEQLGTATAAQDAYEQATRTSEDGQRAFNLALQDFNATPTIQNLQAVQAAVRNNLRDARQEAAEAKAALEASLFTVFGQDLPGFGTAKARADLAAVEAEVVKLEEQLEKFSDTDLAVLGDSVEAQTVKLRALNQVTLEVGNATAQVVPTVLSLKAAYGESAVEIQRNIELQNQLAATSANAGFTNSLGSVSELLQTLELTNEEALFYEQELQRIGQLGTFAEQATAVNQLVPLIIAAANGSKEQQAEAAKVLQELLDSVAAGLELEQAANGISFDGATSSAQALADTLGIALSAALELQRVTPEMVDEDAAFSQQVIPDASARAGQRAAVDNFTRLTTPKKTRGGGAAEQNALAQATQNLIDKFKEETAAIGLTGAALEEFKIRTELANAAKRDGVELSEQVVQRVLAEKAAYEEAVIAADTFANGAKQGFQELRESAQSNSEFAAEFTKNAFNGVSDVISEFVKTGKLNFKDLIADLLGQIAQFLANKLVTDFLGTASGGFPGVGGGVGQSGGTLDFLGGLAASAFGGGMAKGGYASGNSSYLVGEQGPELFTPPAGGGVITPAGPTADAMGGGGNNITVNIQTPDAASFKRSQGQVAAQMARVLERSNTRNN